MEHLEALEAGSASSFVGREKEISEITNLLVNPECRLLSLIGSGGIGKTRLARQAAGQVEADFPHGIHFVALQAATSPSELISAVADVVGSTPSTQPEADLQLFNYLQGKKLMLLLDNFEQLVPVGGAEIPASILLEAPEVKIMVTSRRALKLQQEWRYPVMGLPVPEEAHVQVPRSYPSVELFLDRARRVRPDFSLDEELAGVVRVCQLTEGFPLALELAASWVQALSCGAIADEIEGNLEFLATNLQNVPDRHRTMKAVFAHSWELMSERERGVFRRLSVFCGGFDRQAAQAVADAGPSDLTALIDQSLLRRESNGRYRMHELLRQYGNEKLHGGEKEAARTQARHSAHYATFLEDRLGDLHAGDQRKALGAISAELENVRTSWRWAVAQADVEGLNRAATAYYLYCQMRSRYREGVQAFEQAATIISDLTRSEQRDRTLVRLHNHAGWLWIRMGEFERAKAALERCQELYTQPDLEPPAVMGGDPRSPLAIIAAIQGDPERAAALGEAVRLEAEDREDPHNLPFAFYVLIVAELARGNYKAARDHAERACHLASRIGNQWFLAYPMNEWGHVERALGNYDQAQSHYQASYAIKESFDDAQGMAVALNHLGELALRREEPAEARARFLESRDIYQDINDPGGMATSLKGLGRAAVAAQDIPRACQHYLQALKIASEIEFTSLILRLFTEVDTLLDQRHAESLNVALLALVVEHPASDHETRSEAARRLERQESHLAEDTFDRARARGKGWDLEQAAMALKSKLTTPAEDPSKATAHFVEDQPLIEPLTQRELEVLGLLAKGYTNPQIAEELVIALGTVKWYASEIYGKLGVSNRTQAAHRAHELDLLPPNGGQGS